jgi:hypothetical protein
MSNVKRLIEDFNYFFDNEYGDIKIAGINFSASDILKEMDPIAYNEEFMSYCDMMGITEYNEETYA